MKRLRLVLISRRFWPMVGGAETAMATFAEAWQSYGAEVSLLTARWDPGWPAELNHNGLWVHRLNQPRQRFWGTWRYMYALSRWLRDHRSRFDLCYVSMLKHDAYCAVTTGRKLGFPVVLRAEGAGDGGDIDFHRTANFGQRIQRRTMEADRFVAPSQAIATEMLAAGYPADRLLQIPNGVRVPEPPTLKAKYEARHALAYADPHLMLPLDAKLVVFTGRFHAVKNLASVVDVWRSVLHQEPHAHLWLIGDGPERAALEHQVQELRLRSRIAVAGPFDLVEDVLRAADAFILPSREEGMSLSLLEAMAHGLPAVVSDIPGNRQLITPFENGLAVPPGHPERLVESILRVLSQTEYAAQLGAAARARVAASFTLEAAARRHYELFTELVENRRRQEAP